MSRTLAHVPLWTRLEHRVAIHDHRHSLCDLPDHPVDRASEWPQRTRCRWSHDWDAMAPICPCELCHGGSLNRAERRADRHRSRLQLRAQGRPASAFDD